MESIQYLGEYTARLPPQPCVHDEHAAHFHGYHHVQHATAHSPMHPQGMHQQVLPHFVPGFAFDTNSVRFGPADQYHHHHNRPFGPESSPWRFHHHGRGGGSARPYRGGSGR